MITIAGYTFDFNEDEVEILLEVARGLEAGRKIYGAMDLGKPRDWAREADAEDRDWLVYRAALIICERKARKGKAHE